MTSSLIIYVRREVNAVGVYNFKETQKQSLPRYQTYHPIQSISQIKQDSRNIFHFLLNLKKNKGKSYGPNLFTQSIFSVSDQESFSISFSKELLIEGEDEVPSLNRRVKEKINGLWKLHPVEWKKKKESRTRKFFPLKRLMRKYRFDFITRFWAKRGNKKKKKVKEMEVKAKKMGERINSTWANVVLHFRIFQFLKNFFSNRINCINNKSENDLTDNPKSLV